MSIFFYRLLNLDIIAIILLLSSIIISVKTLLKLNILQVIYDKLSLKDMTLTAFIEFIICGISALVCYYLLFNCVIINWINIDLYNNVEFLPEIYSKIIFIALITFVFCFLIDFVIFVIRFEFNRRKNKKIILETRIKLNKPIKSTAEDILGTQTQVDIIDNAIDSGAKTIGLLSSFGSGKSSIINLLSRKKKYKNTIKINLWQCEYEERDKKLLLNNIIKSFLYQLALGVKTYRKHNHNYAKNVNKRLGSKYAHLSFSMVKTNIVFLILGILFFGAFFATKNLIEIKQWISPLSLYFGIVFLFLSLRKSSISYSHAKLPNYKEADDNEIVDIFNDICLELHQQNNDKVLIVVEDLDRIEQNNDIVISFMSEFFRVFNTLPTETLKNLVFIFAIKTEMELIPNVRNNENKKLYPKLFDFTCTLPLLNPNDYESITKKLCEKLELKKCFGVENENELNENVLAWLYYGDKLNIRIINDRINKAVIMHQFLIGRGASCNFKTCAALAYLESAFPSQIEHCRRETFMDSLLMCKQTSAMNDLKTILINKIKSLDRSFEFTDVLDEFNNILVDMIISNIIGMDYDQYFFLVPRDKKLKTKEQKEIQKAIIEDRVDDKNIFNNAMKEFDYTITESLQRVVALGNKFNRYIYSHSIIFEEAFDKFNEKLCKELKEKYDHGDSSSIEKLLKFNSECKIDHEKFVQWLISNVEIDKTNAALYKKLLIKYFYKYNEIFIVLFKKYSITKDEVDSIKKEDPKDVNKFVFTEYFDNEGIEKIENVIDILCDISNEINEVCNKLFYLYKLKQNDSNAIKCLNYLCKNNYYHEEFLITIIKSTYNILHDIVNTVNQLYLYDIKREVFDQLINSKYVGKYSNEVLAKSYAQKAYKFYFANIKELNFALEEYMDNYIAISESIYSLNKEQYYILRVEFIKHFVNKNEAQEKILNLYNYTNTKFISEEELFSIIDLQTGIKFLKAKDFDENANDYIIKYFNNLVKDDNSLYLVLKYCEYLEMQFALGKDVEAGLILDGQLEIHNENIDKIASVLIKLYSINNVFSLISMINKYKIISLSLYDILNKAIENASEIKRMYETMVVIINYIDEGSTIENLAQKYNGEKIDDGLVQLFKKYNHLDQYISGMLLNGRFGDLRILDLIVDFNGNKVLEVILKYNIANVLSKDESFLEYINNKNVSKLAIDSVKEFFKNLPQEILNSLSSIKNPSVFVVEAVFNYLNVFEAQKDYILGIEQLVTEDDSRQFFDDWYLGLIKNSYEKNNEFIKDKDILKQVLSLVQDDYKSSYKAKRTRAINDAIVR